MLEERCGWLYDERPPAMSAVMQPACFVPLPRVLTLHVPDSPINKRRH